MGQLRDLVRVVLEPQEDSAAAPSYSIQVVYAKLGEVAFGSSHHLALLFDGNRDGRFSKDLLDGMFVDLNDDRHFEIDLASPEFAPLRVPFELAGSIYEAASVAADGSNVVLRRTGPAPPFRVARIGETAPDFSWPAPNGHETDLQDFRGKPTVLYFWTSWCPACRAQAVKLADLLARFRPSGLQVIGVNLESERSGAESFLATYGAGWTNDLTGREFWESGTARRYGISGPGILCLVDRDGTLVAQSTEIADIEKALTH